MAQVVERGYAVSEVAEGLGISTKSLYTWKAQFAQSPSVRSEVADHAAEIRRLKRELARVTKDRTIWSPASHGLLANHCRFNMGSRGNCHDNAVAESFFHLLKRERIRRQTYLTRAAARQDVFNYIEMFYNPTCKHTNNGMLSPVDYETKQQKLNEAGVSQTRGTSHGYSLSPS